MGDRRSLTDYLSAQKGIGKPPKILSLVPGDLLDQIDAHLADPHGPRARRIQRWLKEDWDIDIPKSTIEGYCRAVMEGHPPREIYG